MTADALILATGAAATYSWLCAAVAPVGLALNHLVVMVVLAPESITAVRARMPAASARSTCACSRSTPWS